MKQNQELTHAIAALIGNPETNNEFVDMLHCVAYTIGGLICYVEHNDRSRVLMDLSESLNAGLIKTAERIGEPMNGSVLKQ